MLYTSRFANPELKTGDYTPVRISLGAPRWRTGYTLAGAIKELMPAGLRQIQDIEEFSLKYYKRLDSFGVDVIKKQLQYYESLGKPVVLLCFEDIRKGGDNWCHRTLFAKWWYARTGEIITELKDNAKYKIEGAPIVMPDVPNKEANINADNQIEITKPNSEDEVLIRMEMTLAKLREQLADIDVQLSEIRFAK